MTGQDLAAAAALLPLAGFAGCLRDTLRGTTQPNRVSWALWAAAPMIAFAAQVTVGTSLRASLVTLALGLGPAAVLAASLAGPRAYWQIGRLDWACAAIAVAALAAWAATRRGDAAIALAITADALAAVPTIRKAWSHPASESAGTYLASGAGAAITLLTVTRWTFGACGFSAYAVIVCTVISVLIVVPRTAGAKATAAFAAAVIPIAAIPWAGLHIAALLLPPQPHVITPAAAARPHASPSALATRRERRQTTAPQHAPLPPPPHSPAAKPPPPRTREPRPSPRPPTTKPSPSPPRTPTPPRNTSPSPYPPSPTLSVSPPPTPSAPSPSPTPTPTYPSPAPSPSPYT